MYRKHKMTLTTTDLLKLINSVFPVDNVPPRESIYFTPKTSHLNANELAGKTFLLSTNTINLSPRTKVQISRSTTLPLIHNLSSPNAQHETPSKITTKRALPAFSHTPSTPHRPVVPQTPQLRLPESRTRLSLRPEYEIIISECAIALSGLFEEEMKRCHTRSSAYTELLDVVNGVSESISDLKRDASSNIMELYDTIQVSIKELDFHIAQVFSPVVKTNLKMPVEKDFLKALYSSFSRITSEAINAMYALIDREEDDDEAHYSTDTKQFIGTWLSHSLFQLNKSRKNTAQEIRLAMKSSFPQDSKLSSDSGQKKLHEQKLFDKHYRRTYCLQKLCDATIIDKETVIIKDWSRQSIFCRPNKEASWAHFNNRTSSEINFPSIRQFLNDNLGSLSESKLKLISGLVTQERIFGFIRLWSAIMYILSNENYAPTFNQQRKYIFIERCGGKLQLYFIIFISHLLEGAKSIRELTPQIPLVMYCELDLGYKNEHCFTDVHCYTPANKLILDGLADLTSTSPIRNYDMLHMMRDMFH